MSQYSHHGLWALLSPRSQHSGMDFVMCPLDPISGRKDLFPQLLGAQPEDGPQLIAIIVNCFFWKVYGPKSLLLTIQCHVSSVWGYRGLIFHRSPPSIQGSSKEDKIQDGLPSFPMWSAEDFVGMASQLTSHSAHTHFPYLLFTTVDPKSIVR